MAAATGAGRGSFAAARPTDHCAVGWLRQFRNPFNAHTNAALCDSSLWHEPADWRGPDGFEATRCAKIARSPDEPD